MSFHLAYSDDHALLSSSHPLLKAQARQDFTEAAELLVETRRLRETAAAEAQAARDAAHREGLAEARASAHQAIVTGLADLTTAIEAHAEARRADIAEAAFAAARAIVGAFDATDAMQRIVDRTLARLDAEAAATIEVAPALAPALAEALRTKMRDRAEINVVDNPALGPTDCHIMTASGRIIASLEVQFDALAARWGVAHADR